MSDGSPFSIKKALVFFVLLLTAGFLLAPLLAYWVGLTLVGPYEGDGGMVGYLSAIWNGLGRGESGALILVFSPLIAGIAWFVSLKWIGRGRVMSD